MKLPELSESASPEFTDAATAKAWLEHVPLANVAAAQSDLLEQLEEFNSFPAAATQRLGVLEALREAVNFVQIEQAKRFSNRALPMTEQEGEAFDTTIGLWDQMMAGYQRCVDGAINKDAGMRAQAALAMVGESSRVPAATFVLPLMIVLLPTLFASFYASYRDVFGYDAAP